MLGLVCPIWCMRLMANQPISDRMTYTVLCSQPHELEIHLLVWLEVAFRFHLHVYPIELEIPQIHSKLTHINSFSLGKASIFASL